MPQTETVILRELRYLCFSIFLIERPETLQFVLVNGATPYFRNFAPDSGGESLHRAARVVWLSIFV
jgi:hypothetical protein